MFRELEQWFPTQTDWYDGGYRANIVTFTIAKLAQLIAEQGLEALNVQSIWRTQSISPALSAQLKVVARAMYSVITSPEQGLENVTEWCKKELAWQRAQQQSVRLLPELSAELVSQAEELEREADAVDTARIDAGIAAVTEVVNYKSSNWRTLRDWSQRNELTAREDQLLLFAATAGRVQASDKRQRFSKFDGGWRPKGFRSM
ncbi:MAG: hypothetical protein IPH51_24460 [Rubrivivax sp.]|nr:hypothetical protein [Rubrivivax sp.]